MKSIITGDTDPQDDDVVLNLTYALSLCLIVDREPHVDRPPHVPTTDDSVQRRWISSKEWIHARYSIEVTLIDEAKTQRNCGLLKPWFCTTK